MPGNETGNEPTPEEMAAMEAMEMRAKEQKAALEEAHEALTEPLAATLNTQEALDAANTAHTALTTAIAAAADVSAADKAKYENAASAAMGTIASAQKIFDAAKTEAARKQAEADAKALNEMAMKLNAAIVVSRPLSAPTSGAEPIVDNESYGTGSGVEIFSSAFHIDDSDEAEAASSVVIGDSMVTLQRVANGSFADAANRELKLTDQPVASLGGWQGKRYERKGSDGKVLDTAVIYTNQEAATQEPFATKHAGIIESSGENLGAVLQSNFVNLKPMSREFRNFPGTKTHKLAAGSTASHIIVSGTLDGATGQFRCLASNVCTSAGGPEGSTLLSDGWFFVPAAGAMTTPTPDTRYAGFGWWAQGDSNGADGLYVVVRSGPDADAKFVLSQTGGADVITAFKGLSGTATYNGHAAGKVAMYQSSDGNLAGTFTANVALIADFGAADTGSSIDDGDASIKGTLNGFMVDGVAMDDWKVEFQDNRTMTNRLGGFADGGGISYFGNTKWSIGDKEGDGTGRYNGVYIDQADSGLMRATVGRFTAQYGTVGSMTGGFGATTIDPDE